MAEVNFVNLQRFKRFQEMAYSCIGRGDFVTAQELAEKMLGCEVAGYPFYATAADIYRKVGNDKKADEMIAKLVTLYKKLPK